MLTIFTTCKPFRGHFTVIQENAIASWTKLKPKPEIILIGDDFGTDEIAKKYHSKHIRDVKKNSKGTPILSDIFDKARRVSKNKTLCYVNADIVLPPDFSRIVTRVPFRKFLITGQRWNLTIGKKLDFKKGWFEEFKTQAEKKGKLDQPGALDYFIFPKNVDFKTPPFAVGRGVWDNWLIYKAKLFKIPVIDATETMTVIHQNHDYSHAGGYRAVWHGQEREQNLRLAHEKRRPFNLVNADYKLAQNGLSRPDFSLFRLWRNFQVSPVIKPKLAVILWPPVLTIELLIKVYRKLVK